MISRKIYNNIILIQIKGEFGGCSIIPVTLGHEFSGVVVGVGRKDQVIQLGAKVAIDPNSGCMKCSFCLTGKYHFCRGNIPIGVKRDGGFARYCKVPLALVHVLPPSVSLQQGISLLDNAPNYLVGCVIQKGSIFKWLLLIQIFYKK